MKETATKGDTVDRIEYVKSGISAYDVGRLDALEGMDPRPKAEWEDRITEYYEEGWMKGDDQRQLKQHPFYLPTLEKSSPGISELFISVMSR